MEMAPASEPLDLAVDVRHVTTAISAPADTAATTIYETTITTTPAHNTTSVTAISETTATPDRLDHVPDARHISTPPTSVPNQLEHEAATTTMNMVIERDNEAVKREKEQERGAEKQCRVREAEAERQGESDTGSRRGSRRAEVRYEVTHHHPQLTPHPSRQYVNRG